MNFYFMASIIVTLLVSVANAAGQFPYEGEWKLIDHRCISKADGSRLPMKRELYEKGLHLTIKDGQLTESAAYVFCDNDFESSFEVVARNPVTIRLTNWKHHPCTVDGVTFSNSRGVDQLIFSYRLEGRYLVEDEKSCHDGDGTYQWIFAPLSAYVF